MAVSRASVLALCAAAVGAAALVVPAMSPDLAGAAPAADAPGGCTATVQVQTQWGSGANGGQILAGTVTNASAATTTKWAVTWTLGTGQRVVSAWNAVVTTSGTTATAVNAPYDGVLAPDASTTFGLQLSGIASAPTPTCDNGASTPPTLTPPGGADVTVGQADSQSTFTLVAGETLGVSLGSEFLPPTVGGAALATVSVSGGYPTGQALSGLYRAVAPGSADVTTRSDNACLHTTPPCAVPVRFWTVHINVIASAQTVVVTAADNQSTVRLHVGDALLVNLASDYLPPKLSAAYVLMQRYVHGGYSTGQPLTAGYLAVGPGTVGVSTMTDAPCNHDPTPCPSPGVPWTITVAVTP
jgi:hypothetical protein